ncbi:MAG TPA: aminotransferase class III-fold pyridoxal phosphate-dependent enzyme [Desulfomonilia bacterium]
MSYSHDKSIEWFKRAAERIPQGIYGHFSPALTSPGDFPCYTDSAKGVRIRDVDGNEYLDFVSAYGPMILGYADPDVDAAFAKQAKKGTSTFPPSTKMVELAELVCETINAADWVYFTKNGADTTSWAINIARGHTRRNKILLGNGVYHGAQTWAGTNHYGNTPTDRSEILMTEWGNLEDTRRVVEQHKGEIAAIMMTPTHTPTFEANLLPGSDYWPGLRKLCDENGIILIADDVRSGWRLDIKGAAHYFGVEPDIQTFGKAIANGYPISMVVGKKHLKVSASKSFMTGSFFFNSPEMAAAIACINKMKKIDAAGICTLRGQQFKDGMESLAATYGLQFAVTGHVSMPYIIFTNEKNFKRSQYFVRECNKNGLMILWHHNMFLSAAHTEKDINDALNIADGAFKKVKEKFGC